MKLENGMYEIDDRPMEMRSKEEIDAIIAQAPPELLEKWDREAEEYMKKHGINPKGEGE